jgi:hypothetical protein
MAALIFLLPLVAGAISKAISLANDLHLVLAAMPSETQTERWRERSQVP